MRVHVNQAVVEVMLTIYYRLGCPDICIAGGAVRDQIIGQPVHDWDILVNGPTPEELMDIDWEVVTGKQVVRKMDLSNCPDYVDSGVIEIVLSDSTHIQLICTGDKSTEEYVKDFSCNGSMVTANIYGEVTVYRPFNHFMNGYLIMREGCAGSYANKMMDRFKDKQLRQASDYGEMLFGGSTWEDDVAALYRCAFMET